MIVRVRSWMKHPVVGVKPRDSAAHARVLMAQHRVNQLPVFQGPQLVGIVTDRDLRDAFPSLAETVIQSRRRLPKGADPSAIPVEDVMTHDVLLDLEYVTVHSAFRLKDATNKSIRAPNRDERRAHRRGYPIRCGRSSQSLVAGPCDCAGAFSVGSEAASGAM